jgi:hypothetical protein
VSVVKDEEEQYIQWCHDQIQQLAEVDDLDPLITAYQQRIIDVEVHGL